MNFTRGQQSTRERPEHKLPDSTTIMNDMFDILTLQTVYKFEMSKSKQNKRFCRRNADNQFFGVFRLAKHGKCIFAFYCLQPSLGLADGRWPLSSPLDDDDDDDDDEKLELDPLPEEDPEELELMEEACTGKTRRLLPLPPPLCKYCFASPDQDKRQLTTRCPNLTDCPLLYPCENLRCHCTSAFWRTCSTRWTKRCATNGWQGLVAHTIAMLLSGLGSSARVLGRASSFENDDLKTLSHNFLRASTSCYNHVCLWVEDHACPADVSMLFARMPLKRWTMSGRRCFHIPGRKNQILHVMHGAQTEAKQQTHGGIELEWQCKPNLTDWKTLGGT